MNKVMLIGRLTKDPELRYTPGNATAVCTFSLAVDRRANKDGKKDTDFINIVAFGKTAEIIAQYMTKGRLLSVAGRIQTSSYDGKDGIKRYKTDVVVDDFQFIDSKGGKTTVQQQENTSNGDFGGYAEPVGGDIPF